MQAWFISDIHIKSLNERNSIKLLRFLRSISSGERSATHLFFVGDIFDVWVGDSDVFYRKFKEIIDVILAIKNSGVEVFYFEGNHDVHVKKFWQRFDISSWSEEKYFKLGPWRVRVEHGDLINLNDSKYLKYRDFIRRPRIEKLAYALSGHFWQWLGQRASKKSRSYSAGHRASREAELRELIRAHAERTYLESPFDYVVTGHMHIRDEYQIGSDQNKAVSINLGSWFDFAQALEINDSGYAWHQLD